ncbi:hypothetical protein CC2G_012120 [Coprinopsis cinerea AmutBmut pab1-1]|nr:hypothetical protein CC2G_012120 [Coprinopsis cinerea AmutBmut pab1-1]
MAKDQNWRLPLEIIYHILAFLFDEHCPRITLEGSFQWGVQRPASPFVPRDLKSISQTCRALSEYTRPFVFRCIQISPEPRQRTEKKGAHKLRSTMETYVDLLRINPEVPKHVEYLFINASMEYTTALRPEECIPQMKWRTYLSNSSPYSKLVKQRETWTKALKQRYPKLKWLVLDVPIRWSALAPNFVPAFFRLLTRPDGLEGLVLNPRMKHSSVLRRCKSLQYLVYGGEYVDGPATSTPDAKATKKRLSELPTLKVLDLSTFATSGMAGWFESVSTRAFNCTRLKRCRIPVGRRECLRTYHIDFLRLSGSTLVHVEIYFKKASTTASRSAWEFTPLDFTHFPKLRTLVISAHFSEGEGILGWLSQSVAASGGKVISKIELYIRTENEVPFREGHVPQYDAADPPHLMEYWTSKWSRLTEYRPGSLLDEVELAAFLDTRRTIHCPDSSIIPLGSYVPDITPVQ